MPPAFFVGISGVSRMSIRERAGQPESRAGAAVAPSRCDRPGPPDLGVPLMPEPSAALPPELADLVCGNPDDLQAILHDLKQHARSMRELARALATAFRSKYLADDEVKRIACIRL